MEQRYWHTFYLLTILFSETKESEVRDLLDTLHVYEEILGDAINMQKSENYFSTQVPSARKKEQLQGIFQVIECVGS